ncbi:hypothetical protein WG906_12380 [Pedobacter sp. P351]|uniref:hypothetical protein n=1 Tax=Pedobacter superstes TaxID=3133441 RepID=UPI0030AA8AE4
MKKLKLILSNPCSERWDDMLLTSAGRFCESCEKHIVDLTSKSDEELIQFFKKKKENVCGRMLASQLNRDLVMLPPKASWHWLLPLAMGAIVVTPALANELRPLVVNSDQASALLPASVESAIKAPVVLDTISGIVVDDRTGKPLKGVKVRQKGFENVLALTDSTGKFKLGIKEGTVATAYTFELSGYSGMEAHLDDGMVIKLAIEPSIILGGISTISVNQEPLYLVYADRKSCVIDAAKLSKIPPEWIEKLEVLKDEKATSLYGSKAANGVILIEIKKAYAKKIDFSKKK